MAGKIEVQETKRKIVFASGNQLNLRNVTAFNADGTFLRIWSDEGYILVNTANVDYHIVTPADGPSFGTAPAGTCTWTSILRKSSAFTPSWPSRLRRRLSAACTDSFITFPICPVSVIFPLPGYRVASMCNTSPPVGV